MQEYEGYMCKVDFDYHLEADAYGVKVYPDEETLREHRKCVEGCGIVKVKISLVEVVHEGF